MCQLGSDEGGKGGGAGGLGSDEGGKGGGAGAGGLVGSEAGCQLYKAALSLQRLAPKCMWSLGLDRMWGSWDSAAVIMAHAPRDRRLLG